MRTVEQQETARKKDFFLVIDNPIAFDVFVVSEFFKNKMGIPEHLNAGHTNFFYVMGFPQIRCKAADEFLAWIRQLHKIFLFLKQCKESNVIKAYRSTAQILSRTIICSTVLTDEKKKVLLHEMLSAEDKTVFIPMMRNYVATIALSDDERTAYLDRIQRIERGPSQNSNEENSDDADTQPFVRNASGGGVVRPHSHLESLALNLSDTSASDRRFVRTRSVRDLAPLLDRAQKWTGKKRPRDCADVFSERREQKQGRREEALDVATTTTAMTATTTSTTPS